MIPYPLHAHADDDADATLYLIIQEPVGLVTARYNSFITNRLK